MSLKRFITRCLIITALTAAGPLLAEGSPGEAITVDLYLKDGSHFAQRSLLAASSGMLLVRGKYGSQQIPLADVAQIVLAGGNRDRKGVQLRFGQIGASLKELKNGRWFFDLQDDAGTLAVMDASAVLSISVAEPRVASENPDLRSVNVLQWIADHEPFGAQGNWTLHVAEVTLAENMIVVGTELWSDDPRIVNSAGCNLACRIQDDQGRISDEVWTEYFRVPPQVDRVRLDLRCPLPAPSATSVSIQLRTGNPGNRQKFREDDCAGDRWRALPAVALDLLKR